MALLKKAEVLLMQEDVLVYGFQRVGLPFFHEDDLENARRLFTPSVGEAVLRFRCANERTYVANIRKQTVKRLLEPSSEKLREFAALQVDNIFRKNREENYMSFFRYLAFILDLTVFTHRYKKLDLMNSVFAECGTMFDAFLSAEEGLPFWRYFLALCDTVLRESPEHGRPVRHFRNPALHWDPQDPTFDPDDPANSWVLPNFRLHPDHPILKPDRYAYITIWNEAKSSARGAQNTDEGDEYLNLGVESLNLDGKSSNLVVHGSDTGAESLSVVVDASYLGAQSSNLVVQRSGAESSNLGVQKSCLVAESSNLVLQTSNLGAECSNIDVEKSNLSAECSNIDVERSNLSAECSNTDVENSNLGDENSRLGAVNSSISTETENLNVGTVNTARDENLNSGAASSGTGAENLNFGDENSNSTNENLHPGAENVNPNPFEVIVAAMQSEILNIVWNTDPQDPAFD